MIRLISITKVLVKFSASKNTAYSVCAECAGWGRTEWMRQRWMRMVWGLPLFCVSPSSCVSTGLGSEWLEPLSPHRGLQRFLAGEGGTVIRGAYVLLSRVLLPLTEGPDAANWHQLQRRPQRACPSSVVGYHWQWWDPFPSVQEIEIYRLWKCWFSTILILCLHWFCTILSL